ncbi:P-loop NTPase fold protein [Nocardia sp. KC 131]|uniref:P-loop NTPase fold protein n=1 Tax=Nocardia arseniciresistens TaxID=3392119 RepID=UPI00398EB7CE
MTTSERPSLIDLGTIDRTRYSIARTSLPWELDIDTVVVSVGSTLGELGRALRQEFQLAPWDTIYFEQIDAGHPHILDLRSGASLQRAVLVTPRDEPSDRGEVTSASVRLATRSAVQVAVTAGSRVLGLPLLATGAMAEPVDTIAAIVMPAVVEALRDLREAKLDRLVFLCQTEDSAVAIVREFARLPGVQSAIQLAGGIARDLVDPNVGIPLDRDRLEVAPYVSMLATVMADRHTPLPLSVGVFGEWGSGKSYFMAMMRDRIQGLAGSDSTRYCDEIVQIGFNAWHYADSNLWASLGDEIFRQLAGPDPSAPHRAEQIRTDLAGRLDQRRQLEVATEQARVTAARLQAEVDAAVARRESSARKLIAALRDSAEFGNRVDSLWRQLGITDQVEQAKLFAAQMHGTLTEVDGLRRASADRRGRTALAVAAILLLAGAVAAMLTPAVKEWVAVAFGFVTFCTGGVGLTYLTRARDGLRNLREVTEDVQSEMARAHASGDVELREKLAQLRAAEAEQLVAQSQLDDVVAHVGELGRQLAQLTPGRRLYAFLAERANGDSYTRNLGLISTIRKDFEQLVELMKDWRENPEDWDGPRRPVDRIVLYIDDLDRCRPDQVVEVLQAVHLLLAFELFVVVVGVDPRWLLRSLHSQYSDLLHDGVTGDPADDWHTPEDYLEKILNIPIMLPAMPSGSLGRLLRSLEDDAAVARPLLAADRRGSGDHPSPLGAAPVNTAQADAAAITIERGSEVDTQQRTATAVGTARPLTEPELSLLASLDLLIATPREAKRLVNLYRMVRATRDLSDASQFLGLGGTRPGQYQAVVLLLGLLTAHARLLGGVLDTRPDPRREIDGGLAHRPPRTPWTRFVADLEPQRSEIAWTNRIVGTIPDSQLAQWNRLHRGIAKVSELVDLPDLNDLQIWLPRIRRFSYVLTSADNAEVDHN